MCLFHVHLQLYFNVITTLFTKSARTKTFQSDHITPMDEKPCFCQSFIHPFIHASIHLYVIRIKTFKPHRSPGWDISHPSFEFSAAGTRTHWVVFACLYLNVLHFTPRSKSSRSMANILSAQHLCSLFGWVMSTNRPQSSFTQPVQDGRNNRYVNLSRRLC